jgi:hypothetical protein
LFFVEKEWNQKVEIDNKDNEESADSYPGNYYLIP